MATASGPINAGPLVPTGHTPTQLSVNVPATTPLGQGFVEVQVVNTDMDFAASNSAPALLQGSAAAGIPSLTSINGKGLAATSSDPDYATNNVEAVVAQGTMVKLGGSGFALPMELRWTCSAIVPGARSGLSRSLPKAQALAAVH